MRRHGFIAGFLGLHRLVASAFLSVLLPAGPLGVGLVGKACAGEPLRPLWSKASNGCPPHHRSCVPPARELRRAAKLTWREARAAMSGWSRGLLGPRFPRRQQSFWDGHFGVSGN